MIWQDLVSEKVDKSEQSPTGPTFSRTNIQSQEHLNINGIQKTKGEILERTTEGVGAKISGKCMSANSNIAPKTWCNQEEKRKKDVHGRESWISTAGHLISASPPPPSFPNTHATALSYS